MSAAATRQLVLELSKPPAPTLDNFVVGRNAAVVQALRDVVDAPRGETMIVDTMIYLWGEAGSGRTHLLRAVAHSERIVVADDVDRLDDAQQVQLFDEFNRLRSSGGTLVASGGVPVAALPLREDLRTRLGSGLSFQLHALSDAEKAAALRRHAADRGLRLGEDVLGYVLTHLRRDMTTQIAVLDAIDRYSLAAKRPVTLPLVREALQNYHSSTD